MESEISLCQNIFKIYLEVISVFRFIVIHQLETLVINKVIMLELIS